jgi:hypothetical protein
MATRLNRRLSFARTLPDSFNRLSRFPGDSEPCGDGLRAPTATGMPDDPTARSQDGFLAGVEDRKAKGLEWGYRVQLRGGRRCSTTPRV